MKKLFNHIVLSTLKDNSMLYNKYNEVINSDDDLSEYILSLILGNSNIVFYIAKLPIENIKYEINGVKTKHIACVERQKYDLNEFVEFINSIKNNTIFGIHELYVYNTKNIDIEITFYKKEVPNEVIGII